MLGLLSVLSVCSAHDSWFQTNEAKGVYITN